MMASVAIWVVVNPSFSGLSPCKNPQIKGYFWILITQFLSKFGPGASSLSDLIEKKVEFFSAGKRVFMPQKRS